jgi:hypothetical protein
MRAPFYVETPRFAPGVQNLVHYPGPVQFSCMDAPHSRKGFCRKMTSYFARASTTCKKVGSRLEAIIRGMFSDRLIVTDAIFLANTPEAVDAVEKTFSSHLRLRGAR